MNKENTRNQERQGMYYKTAQGIRSGKLIVFSFFCCWDWRGRGWEEGKEEE